MQQELHRSSNVGALTVNTYTITHVRQLMHATVSVSCHALRLTCAFAADSVVNVADAVY